MSVLVHTVVSTVCVPVLRAALPAAPVAALASSEGKGQHSEHWDASTATLQGHRAEEPRRPSGGGSEMQPGHPGP